MVDTFTEMMVNKCSELGCESIPGGVLQIYVWLVNPEDAGSFALVSILISTITTGYTSAMISFDMDVDVRLRKGHPQIYGFISDDNGLRGRCFALMTLISTLHNLSRSLGCAMLAATAKKLLLAFFGGEILLLLLFKLARGDFLVHWRIEGAAGVFASLVVRVAEKIIADFSGCLMLRHPVLLGGMAFSLSMLWAQIFPFVALVFFEDDGNKEAITIFLACR